MKLNSFLLHAALLLRNSTFASVTKSEQLRGQKANETLVCLIVEAQEMHEGGARQYLECELILQRKSKVMHGLRIELPNELVQNHLVALRRGEWFVEIMSATLQKSFVEGHGLVPWAISVSPSDGRVSTIPPQQARLYMRTIKQPSPSLLRNLETGTGHRRQLQSVGTRSVMVIRVSVSDSSPTFTASQLAGYYFDPNSFSFARQYNWCSFGALRFIPFDKSHPVLDVMVPGNAANFTLPQLWPLAMSIGAAQKNVTQLTSLAQHIAIVLPPGLGGGAFYAVATVGFWRSIYSDTWGGYPNFAMHEIGHNLGMGHAGVGTDHYADSSDIMGYGDSQQFGISKCFNGFHLWYLQWFASKSMEVTNPSSIPTLVNLAAFSDFNLTTDASQQYVVVIKVDVYYLVYNRAKGINAGVNDAINMVTVAQAQPGQYSIRVAALDNRTSTSSTYQVPNYAGGTLPLIIEVCSMTKGYVLDYAVVSIGVGVSKCNNSSSPVSAATATITSRPSMVMTLPPTMAPTIQPTVPSPTVAPTVQPTILPPTPLPTLAPTTVPTAPPPPTPSPVVPTVPPTAKPTTKPTAKPTTKPTFKPTGKPTKKPTIKPTTKPTTKPTVAPSFRPTTIAPV